MNEYINSRDKLEDLEKKIVQGTSSLENSLTELKQLAQQVTANLDNVKVSAFCFSQIVFLGAERLYNSACPYVTISNCLFLNV